MEKSKIPKIGYGENEITPYYYKLKREKAYLKAKSLGICQRCNLACCTCQLTLHDWTDPLPKTKSKFKFTKCEKCNLFLCSCDN